MKASELKTIRQNLGWTQARLAQAVGIATGSIARQERGELGISEPLGRLLRVIAAGIDVEAVANAEASRGAATPKPARRSKPGYSQGTSRHRQGKNPVR